MSTKKRILLRGSWQTRNIGDIAHTPGFLELARERLPECEIHLWPCEIDRGVREMLLQNYPGLVIADTEEARKRSFELCDLFVHGSGSGYDMQGVELWKKETGKPYGFYGNSAANVWTPQLKELLSEASFIFCRDTISVHFLNLQGVTCPKVTFAPDSTFFLKLQDSGTAEPFLRQNGLEPEKFVCVIPRLRWTPASFDDKRFYWPNPRKEEVSMAFIESDMAKLRELIGHIVASTDLKILICPEMTYQIPMGRNYIYDRLTPEVKKRCVFKEEYWITDEAQGVYAFAHSLVSMEMHSPIMFAVAGRPAILLRQAEDTWKGQMWRDIGLQSWILELNNTESREAAAVLDGIVADYPGARAKTRAALATARQAGFAAADYIASLLK